jgi:hypothetical protein
MTSGVLFALAMAALVVAVVIGLMRRNRITRGLGQGGGDNPNTVAQ